MRTPVIERIRDDATREFLRGFLRVLRRSARMLVAWIDEALEESSLDEVYPGFDDVIVSKRDYDEIAKRVAEILERKQR